MLCAMSDSESDRKERAQTGQDLLEVEAAGAGPEAVAALVLGAGRGERLGHALPKAFVPLLGQTLVERSIRTLAQSGAVGWIQPVLDAGEFDRFKDLKLQDIRQLAPPIAGGYERQDSMRAGLASLPNEIRWVAVHDAARCLVSTADVARVIAIARQTGAAILAERVRDTIKRVVDGKIVETPPRENCWAAQTPQVMRRDWLANALDKAAAGDRVATDDAEILEWAGYPVAIVEALSANPKITRPEDLVAAEAIASAVPAEQVRALEKGKAG